MNKLKEIKHIIIISLDIENPFDKIQHLFVIKVFEKSGIQGTYLHGAFIYISSSPLGAGWYSEVYQREKNVDTNVATKCFTYILSCLQNILGQRWQRICDYSQPRSDLT